MRTLTRKAQGFIQNFMFIIIGLSVSVLVGVQFVSPIVTAVLAVNTSDSATNTIVHTISIIFSAVLIYLIVAIGFGVGGEIK